MEQAWLEELSEFLRIPSVSADPAHANDITRAAEWLRDFIARSGGSAEVRTTKAHPLVVGEIRASNGADNAPTVLIYGHFDVQPPAPIEQWDTPPFEPTIRGEWLYARGVVDDKGQLYSLVKAAALVAAEGRLPVNVRVASDGEEEIGGHSVIDFIAQDERGADVCVIFDGGMSRRDVPEFAVGTRGLISYVLHVRTGERDLHSGLYGNAALNAIHALMEALGALMPRNGRLPEPLREGIAPLTDAERQAWTQLKSGDEMLADGRAVPHDERAAEEFHLRTTAEPSFDVTGILGGKPGLINTTISAVADANFTLRLAPGQDVDTIHATVERLVRDAVPEGATVELMRDSWAAPGRVDVSSPAVQLALDVFERTVGRRPLLARSGGTLPIIPALEHKGIPTVLTGFGLLESNVHSPNERMLLEYLPLAIETACELYVSFANLR